MAVRAYKEGDEREIVPLLELVFEEWPHFDIYCASLDHWRWKFLDNPVRSKTISVGIVKGKIVGCHHTIPLRVKVGAKVYLAALGADAAVHPDYRRLGLYNRMRDLSDEQRVKMNMEFNFSETTSPILIQQQLREGRSYLGENARLVRVRDIDLHLKMTKPESAFAKKVGFNLVNIFKKFGNALYGSVILEQDFNISRITHFGHSIDVFWLSLIHI